ncbi:hypothetical protein ACQ4WY_03815 [Janthinobacterium sp. LB2P49]|uniref:hypothetical protein n=1 Tax=Janthinobacterium sp. LB2P49 TaxID=3424198 RepID=UPI003F26F636
MIDNLALLGQWMVARNVGVALAEVQSGVKKFAVCPKKLTIQHELREEATSTTVIFCGIKPVLRNWRENSEHYLCKRRVRWCPEPETQPIE